MGKFGRFFRKFLAKSSKSCELVDNGQNALAASKSFGNESRWSDVEDEQQDDDAEVLPTTDIFDEPDTEGAPIDPDPNTYGHEDGHQELDAPSCSTQPIPNTQTQHKCHVLFVELEEQMPFVDELMWLPNEDEVSTVVTAWTDHTTDWWTFQRQLGEAVYEYVFDATDDVKLLFPQAKCYGHQWKNNPRFRRQSLRFAQSLDDIVQRLSRPEELDSYLYELGSWHVRYVGRGMHAGMWSLFQLAIEQAALKFMLNQSADSHTPLGADQELTDTEMSELWHKLSVLIVQKMYVGFADTLISEYCEAHCDCTGWSRLTAPVPKTNN